MSAARPANPLHRLGPRGAAGAALGLAWLALLGLSAWLVRAEATRPDLPRGSG